MYTITEICHSPVWMGSFPAGKCVGRESTMNDCKVCSLDLKRTMDNLLKQCLTLLKIDKQLKTDN